MSDDLEKRLREAKDMLREAQDQLFTLSSTAGLPDWHGRALSEKIRVWLLRNGGYWR